MSGPRLSAGRERLCVESVADFCRRIRVNYFTLSHESETCSRSPAISSTTFDTRPPDLPPAFLMDTDFAISCLLVRRRRPQIQFLSIGPYLCSTLPSDPASRRRPCASLPFTSIRLGRDFHPLVAEHARRTTKSAGATCFPRFLPLSAVRARFIRHSRLRLRRCNRAPARSSRQCASSRFHS
jgi:hypothetical protein